MKSKNGVTESMRKKVAFLRFSQGAMRGEVSVGIIGEDGDRYKIQTDHIIKLPDNSLDFEPGQTLYVPKSSVVIAAEQFGQVVRSPLT